MLTKLEIGSVYFVKKPLRVYWADTGTTFTEKSVLFLKTGGKNRTHEYYFLYENEVVHTYLYGDFDEYFKLIC